jgi:hypothetical protein
MTDNTWPSVYFAYLFFAICLFVAVYFFLRSWSDGYWGARAEEVKYRMLDDCGEGTRARGVHCLAGAAGTSAYATKGKREEVS